MSVEKKIHTKTNVPHPKIRVDTLKNNNNRVSQKKKKK